MKKLYNLLPSIDSLLTHPLLASPLKIYTRETVKTLCRLSLEQMRGQIDNGHIDATATQEMVLDDIAARVVKELDKKMAPSLKKVINATGIVLHTGLGRALLSQAAQDHVNDILNGYVSLELDLPSGKRGERTDHVRSLLCEITGAENALVVNNNAAAVLIALNTLSFGKEAVISRGELVEIGGSFRMPEIMDKSGVIMREVGTTNKTRLSDYRKAINPNTGAIVIAHTSNYRVLGFTEKAALKDVCTLAHDFNIPVIHDLGAGIVFDLQTLGLPHEPLVQESLTAGADVVTFSGDKVLGGPQCGLVVGKKEWLSRIHNNPIMRAVRCDKLIYAALEGTLKLFLRNDLFKEHAVLRTLVESNDSIKKRARQLLNKLDDKTVKDYRIHIKPCSGQVGSGALPLETLDSTAVVLEPTKQSAEEIGRQLRSSDPPVIGYVKEDKVWLDMRTVGDENLDLLRQCLTNLQENKEQE